MKEYRDCIKLLVIISCCIPYILGAPNEDEQQKKNSKKMPLVMQTLLADIAGELLSRSTSNSQVLTLNFTNLLILLMLKGLLWGVSYADKSRNRDLESEKQFITETEIVLLLSYLIGDDQKNFECLHRIACEDPNKAAEYMNAGTILMNAVKYIGISPTTNDKYENLLYQLQDALQFKKEGGDCANRYSCLHQQKENTTS